MNKFSVNENACTAAWAASKDAAAGSQMSAAPNRTVVCMNAGLAPTVVLGRRSSPLVADSRCGNCHEQRSGARRIGALRLLALNAVFLLWCVAPAMSQCPPTWVQRSVTSPSARNLFTMVYDPIRGHSLLFGGYNGSYLGDTWGWNGSLWTSLATTGPTARHSYAMAYNTATGNTLLFGGDIGGSFGAGFRNDTWEWTGTGWISRGSGGPVARVLVRMAYDPTRARMVLFGGVRYQNGLVPVGDTWEWDGTMWTQQATSGPTARYDHAMVFDPGRGHVILFGGFDSTNQYKNDTWEWNGTNWTPLASSGPPARYRHALAYDAGRARVILFGGSNSTISFNDTWEWSGVIWSQLMPTVSPTGRRAHGMAYDPTRYRCVVFGGTLNSPTSPLAETWELTLSASASILAQPSDAASCPVGLAGFTLTATGTAPLTYQWQIETLPGMWQSLGNDPVPIPCGGFAFATPINSPTVNIGVRNCPGPFRVRCVVSNACGGVTSNPATLTVYPGGSGDGDAGGTADGDDVQGFMNTLLQGGSPNAGYCAYDMTGDGVVSAADVPGFVNALLGL